MRRLKTGGRVKGTPNAINADIRQLMSNHVAQELEFIQTHLHEFTVAERIMLLKSLFRYVIAPLAPEGDTVNNSSQVVLNVHSDL
jgi:hypothetical protein